VLAALDIFEIFPTLLDFDLFRSPIVVPIQNVWADVHAVANNLLGNVFGKVMRD